jgi:hypothetical protein
MQANPSELDFLGEMRVVEFVQEMVAGLEQGVKLGPSSRSQVLAADIKQGQFEKGRACFEKFADLQHL